jgi:hypothetical protein
VHHNQSPRISNLLPLASPEGVVTIGHAGLVVRTAPPVIDLTT